MANRFSVETVFKGVDRMTAPLKRMNKGVNKFTRNMRFRFKLLNEQASRLGKTLKKIAVIGVASFALLGAAAGNVIAIGAEFEQTLVNAAAKFPEGIRKGTEAFENLETVARQVGATTEFTASQAAEGLNFLAMAGFNAEQSMAALPGVVDLATAAQIDLGLASDIATDSLGAFGLATKNPIQLSKNLARVSDVLALATVRTNTNMEQLFEGIVKGAPAFTTAGQSMESFTALMGVMANSGIKGGEAGTILRNTILRLSNPVGAASTVMKNLGVSVADSDGNFRDILDIMEDFEKGLKGVGEVQKTAALATVFGTRAVSGLSVQLKEGTTSIAGFRKELEGAAGTSATLASVMRDTLKGDINSANSAFEGLKITLFKLKETGIREVIQATTEIIRNFNALINVNKELSTELIDGIFKVLKGLIGLFTILLVKFAFLKIQIIAIAVASNVWALSLAVLNGALGLFNIMISAAKIGMAAFNVVMALNPIGAIILAVMLLIGLGFLLIKNWDLIVAKIKSAAVIIGKVLSSVFSPFTNIISGLTSIFKGSTGLLLGGGSEKEEEKTGTSQSPQLVTPQDSLAQTITETREKSTIDLNIKGDTDRVDVQEKGNIPGLKLSVAGSGGL